MSERRGDSASVRPHLGRVLFVVCRPRLALAMAVVDANDEYYLGDECTLGDIVYHHSSYGAVTDFVDWLRDFEGKVIGVGFWLFEEMHVLSSDLQRLSYVVTADDRVNIYFSTQQDIDPQQSADQEFLTTRAYRSVQGEWAIAFHATSLSQMERENLSSVDAEWITTEVTIALQARE